MSKITKQKKDAPAETLTAIENMIGVWRSLAQISREGADLATKEGNQALAQSHAALSYGRASCAQQLEDLLKERGLL
jgi:hypothetical protein